MNLLPLYLRREPTTDHVLLQLIKRGIFEPAPYHLDVVAYRDSTCTRLAARWPWHYTAKPTRRAVKVRFNCYDWAANWLPDMEPAQ